MIRLADIAAQAERSLDRDDEQVGKAVKAIMGTVAMQAASMTADIEHEMFVLIVVAVGTFADATDNPIAIRELAMSLISEEIADLRVAQKLKPEPS